MLNQKKKKLLFINNKKNHCHFIVLFLKMAIFVMTLYSQCANKCDVQCKFANVRTAMKDMSRQDKYLKD